MYSFMRPILIGLSDKKELFKIVELRTIKDH